MLRLHSIARARGDCACFSICDPELVKIWDDVLPLKTPGLRVVLMSMHAMSAMYVIHSASTEVPVLRYERFYTFFNACRGCTSKDLN